MQIPLPLVVFVGLSFACATQQPATPRGTAPTLPLFSTAGATGVAQHTVQVGLELEAFYKENGCTTSAGAWTCSGVPMTDTLEYGTRPLTAVVGFAQDFTTACGDISTCCDADRAFEALQGAATALDVSAADRAALQAVRPEGTTLGWDGVPDALANRTWEGTTGTVRLERTTTPDGEACVLAWRRR